MLGDTRRPAMPTPASARMAERTRHCCAPRPLMDKANGNLEGRQDNHQCGADIAHVIEQAEEHVQLAAETVPERQHMSSYSGVPGASYANPSANSATVALSCSMSTCMGIASRPNGRRK